MEPPVARVAPVRDTHFGVTIDDPYRWMEDESPEFQSWVDGQAAYARELLDALPGREALLSRIRQLRGTTTQRFGFVHANGRAFLFRQEPDRPVPVLVTAAGDGLDDRIDRVLLDPADFDDGGSGPHSSLDWFVPSPDGRYVACGISQGGNEFRTLRVVDVSTGKLLDDAVSNLRPAFVAWLDHNASFTCFRYLDPPSGAPADQRRLDGQTVLHRLGDEASSDQTVLARGLNPRLPLSPLDRPHLIRQPGSAWLLAVVVHTATRGNTDEGLSDCSLFVAPLATPGRSNLHSVGTRRGAG